MAREDDIAGRLAAISEELGDLAYDHLHEASSSIGRGEQADPELLAAERRLTRARRAVDKAVQILRPDGPRRD
ncbi:MAG: hypothetical protein ACYDD4_14090 [Acidimicrobiales bacterium]